MFIETGFGIVDNSYALSWLTKKEVSFTSPLKSQVSFSVGGEIEEKYELHLYYALAQPPSVRITVIECDCSFNIVGPKYSAIGLAFRYKPFPEWRLSPFIGAKYAFNRLKDGENFGYGYLGSVNGYKYFIGNHGPRSRFLSSHGFHAVSLSIGSIYRMTKMFSAFIHLSANATTSDSAIHRLILTFESAESSLYEILYHTGLQTEATIGIRLDLSQAINSF